MPSIVALAGPNGAGKSTAGPALIRDTLGITEFVDADIIARGISAFDPEGAARAAGRIMLLRLRDLSRRHASFAFETTLAGRGYARWIRDQLRNGYEFHLFFLWLPSADFAVDRVAGRVRGGGHGVPEATVRRRYGAGLRNFFGLYQALATTWRMYDNSQSAVPRLIASGERGAASTVTNAGSRKRARILCCSRAPVAGRCS